MEDEPLKNQYPQPKKKTCLNILGLNTPNDDCEEAKYILLLCHNSIKGS